MICGKMRPETGGELYVCVMMLDGRISSRWNEQMDTSTLAVGGQRVMHAERNLRTANE